jgi:hypothetical protein
MSGWRERRAHGLLGTLYLCPLKDCPEPSGPSCEQRGDPAYLGAGSLYAPEGVEGRFSQVS